MTFGDGIDKEGAIKTKPWKQIWRPIRKPGMQMKGHWSQSSDKSQGKDSCGLRDGWKILVLLGKDRRASQSWNFSCMVLVKVQWYQDTCLHFQFCWLIRNNPKTLSVTKSETAIAIYWSFWGRKVQQMGNWQRTGNMHKAALEICDREAVYVYFNLQVNVLDARTSFYSNMRPRASVSSVLGLLQEPNS